MGHHLLPHFEPNYIIWVHVSKLHAVLPKGVQSFATINPQRYYPVVVDFHYLSSDYYGTEYILFSELCRVGRSVIVQFLCGYTDWEAPRRTAIANDRGV